MESNSHADICPRCGFRQEPAKISNKPVLCRECIDDLKEKANSWGGDEREILNRRDRYAFEFIGGT